MTALDQFVSRLDASDTTADHTDICLEVLVESGEMWAP